MERPAPSLSAFGSLPVFLSLLWPVVELLGMWLASFALVVGLGRMWGEKRYLRTSLAAIGLLAVIYLVFVRVLKGNFPGGLIAGLWSEWTRFWPACRSRLRRRSCYWYWPARCWASLPRCVAWNQRRTNNRVAVAADDHDVADRGALHFWVRSTAPPLSVGRSPRS